MDDMPQVGELMQLLNSEDGMAELLKRPVFEDEQTGHTYSQADLIADVVNILRMDSKRMAKAHDLNIEINQMTPDRAAQMLQNVAKGDGLELIQVFDEIEDQRMKIMRELEDDADIEQYMAIKRSVLYSLDEEYDPEEYDTEEDDTEEDSTDED